MAQITAEASITYGPIFEVRVVFGNLYTLPRIRRRIPGKYRSFYIHQSAALHFMFNYQICGLLWRLGRYPKSESGIRREHS